MGEAGIGMGISAVQVVFIIQFCSIFICFDYIVELLVKAITFENYYTDRSLPSFHCIVSF